MILSMLSERAGAVTALVLLAACGGAPTPPPPAPAPSTSPLALYPLAAGAKWTYDVTVDYYGTDGQNHHWEGCVVSAVAAVDASASTTVYTLRTDAYPENPESTAHLVLRANRLYRFEDGHDQQAFLAGRKADVGFAEILVASPEHAGHWGAFAGAEQTGPFWKYEGSESISVPAGRFDHCRSVALRTTPDHTVVWYCPSVGPAQREYGHHGTPRNETWRLRSFERGPP